MRFTPKTWPEATPGRIRSVSQYWDICLADYFFKLAAIARPSKHEAEVSAHLEAWGLALQARLGKEVVQVERDAANNVIVTKAASSAALTRTPLTVLQAHMDMVCIGDSADYNPLSDPVIPVPDRQSIRARGTSLGADDGIGIAMIQCLFDAEDLVHGPLRAIFTTDEESGMSGAQRLAAHHLLDATYLINLDWEEYGSMCIGCADSAIYALHRKLDLAPSHANSLCFELSASEFRGGHSGINIHEGRANALRVLAGIILRLQESCPLCGLAQLGGGQASNAIPASARAQLVVPHQHAAFMQECALSIMADWETEHTLRKGLGSDASEPQAKLELCQTQKSPAASPGVLTPACSGDLLRLIMALPTGVYSMSHEYHGLVKSSCNLGKLEMEGGHAVLELMARSFSRWHSGELRQTLESAAQSRGFTLELRSSAPAWPIQEFSKLQDLVRMAFYTASKQEMQLTPIHAGLECGIFAAKAPQLDMVSLGPSLKNAHSVNEELLLHGLDATLDCLALSLAMIANSKSD